MNKLSFLEANNEYYPYLLIPDQIREAISRDYSEIEISQRIGILRSKLCEKSDPVFPSKYRYVEKKGTSFKGGCALIMILPTAIFFGLMFFSAIGAGSIIVAIIMIVVGLSMFSDLDIGFEDTTSTEKIEISSDEHEKLVERYSVAKKEIVNHNEKAKLRYNFELEEFKREYNANKDSAVKQLFRKELPPESEWLEADKKISQGRTELYFYQYLRANLDYNIYTNKLFTDYEYSFYPDFVIQCPITNLTIDVEIDEPYVVPSGEPIHSKFDDYRDDCFSMLNWVVIRFSEKQIITNPSECCNLIKDLITNICDRRELVEYKVTKDKRWDYSEAERFAKENYRNSYLPNTMKVQTVKAKLYNDFENDLPF